MQVPGWQFDGSVLLIIGNMAALVWGAARLHGSVDNLSKMAAKIETAIDRIHHRIDNHHGRLSSLEARLNWRNRIDDEEEDDGA